MKDYHPSPTPQFRRAFFGLFLAAVLSPGLGLGADSPTAPLPEDVSAAWDLARAHRETTPTRDRICINGLWRWQPATAQSEDVPGGSWGWFKVPGSWPGITDYMQKDSQTVYAHPAWAGQRLGEVSAAWYEREVEVPAEWTGRRIALRLEYLSSLAIVYVNGQRAAELRFPGGEADLTSVCQPGAKHRLSLLVVALPLKGVMLSYSDSASAREVQGRVARRGLCGDAYLVSTPAGPRIGDVKIDPSVRRRKLGIEAALEDLAANERYVLRAEVRENGRVLRELVSPAFSTEDLRSGRFAFTTEWMPERLWDTHTPQNLLQLELTLLDVRDSVLDTSRTARFGFREFWIEGRDFFLNGTRLNLSAVPLDNAQVSAALANYAAARESLERLKTFGINFVYTHNYGCEPGSHLGFAEILRAADDVGMLVGFSQPHFSHYDWQAPDADRSNGYARHAEFYVRAAQNHPSVVAYSMNHNSTGYSEDMNPDMIDGVQDSRDNWARRNMQRALRAEDIVKALDPSRVLYHHASGNLGSMHVINFYPNFVPIQELSDWFGHWATGGVKPVFLCEYGAPFTWDWTMYRGWYQGKREFGSAQVPWEFCLAEWNAQFLGDTAYQISEPEKANLRWEARQFRADRVWHRWDYPNQVGSARFDERYPVFAAYLTDNWRAFRTWGVSAISPWEHGHFWQLRDGVDRSRQPLPVDWDNLQRPGLSPDYIDQRYERMDLAFERSDWIATPAAEALLRNNRPLLAYLGGKPARFTSKDHIFLPGDVITKQAIVINNSREAVSCNVSWSTDLPQHGTQHAAVTVLPGEQQRLPLTFRVPPDLPPGRHQLSVNFQFHTGETQEDQLDIEILPRAEALDLEAKIAVFDPAGETVALLKDLGVQTDSVSADADVAAYDILIVGKGALGLDQPAPDVRSVRQGLKVLVFEQTAEILEQRFGFRIAEYGLRQVFPRISDHPLLAGLSSNHLRDWRGEATILPPRLDYELNPKFNGAPTVEWCGLPVTRLWRCGNRGNVASVLIEKPARGDFLPIVDGGYSLQYSPLLEYREGKGMVLFCQMDVTARTESEPAAQRLTANILQYVDGWIPAPQRTVTYLGEPDGKRHLKSIGIESASSQGGELPADQVFVVGPGGSRSLADHASTVADTLRADGRLLAIGLGKEDLRGWLPLDVSFNRVEHIASFFENPSADSWFAGIGPADVHNRDPRELPLVVESAQVLTIGNGVLAQANTANVAFCQLAPWHFANTNQMNLKRTHRRVSFLLSRLLANLGIAGSTPLLERFGRPVDAANPEQRWLEGFYLDQPEEWDDPYRFFRW